MGPTRKVVTSGTFARNATVSMSKGTQQVKAKGGNQAAHKRGVPPGKGAGEMCILSHRTP